MATGFAVCYQGEIVVATVSETKRAAMVNWLVARDGFVITNSWTDKMIEALFTQRFVSYSTVGQEIRLVPVEIKEISA